MLLIIITLNNKVKEKKKYLSPKEYLDIIRPYLNDMINDHKTQSERKIHLTMQINFISSKDFEVTRTMHTKSSDIKIMIANKQMRLSKKNLILFCKNVKMD